MAHKLNLINPVGRMSYIWNISDRVGLNHSRNNPTDVLLVKAIAFEVLRVISKSDFPSGFSRPLTPDSTVDYGLLFWIIHFNTSFNWKPSMIKDRSELFYASPARGTSYGNGKWTIYLMNSSLYNINPNAWENLPNSPYVTPQLRAELQDSKMATRT
ncbi:MAG: hypothetical protein ACK5NT_09135 [Pyrinomonadaceae bacterium]